LLKDDIAVFFRKSLYFSEVGVPLMSSANR
jgi:hypothetical protein